MRSLHFIRAALALCAAGVPGWAAAQPIPHQSDSTAAYTIFLRAQPIGTEQIALTRSAEGWSIVSSGRVGMPLDVIARRVEARYTPDWRPRELTIDATVRGQTQTLHTVVDGSTARTDFSTNGQAQQK